MATYSDYKRGEPGYGSLTPTTLSTRNDRAPTLQYMGRGRNRMLYPYGDKLYCDGFPVRTIGVVDFYNLQFLQVHGSTNYVLDLKKMNQDGIKFVRSPSGPITAAELNATYYGGTVEKQKYLDDIRRYLDWANYQGIGVILSLFWNYHALPDVASESLTVAYGTNGTLPSSQTMTLAAEYITTIVTEFEDHPSLSGWECGQEYNNVWDLQTDTLTKEAGLAFIDWVAVQVRAIDVSDRIIITGNDGPNAVSSYEEFFNTQLAQSNPASYNTISFGKYQYGMGSRRGDDLTNYLTQCRRVAKLQNKPFILKETGFTQADNTVLHNYNGIDSTESFRITVDSIHDSGTQLAFVWGWADKNYLNTPLDSDFHPNHDLSTYIEKSELLSRANVKLRNAPQAYIDPFDIDTVKPYIFTQNGTINPAVDNEERVMTIWCNSSQHLHSSGQGWGISAWIYIDEIPTSEKVIMDNLYYDFNDTYIRGGCSITLLPSGRISFKIPIQKDIVNGNPTTHLMYSPIEAHCPIVNNKWNHVFLQLEALPLSKNYGITFAWNGVVVDRETTKRFGNRGESSPTSILDGTTFYFNPSNYFSIFGGVKRFFQNSTNIQIPLISPSKCGIANLMFLSRSIDDEEIKLMYVNGTAPLRFSESLQGLVVDEFGGNVTLKDNSASGEPVKMLFPFDNTFTNSSGTIISAGSLTFIPVEVSSIPQCTPATFTTIDQRVYWETNAGI